MGGENAAALVFDLRGAHLVAHRLTAAAGCFDREDAVPCVSYNLAAPHALYCASGRVVTAWDVRRSFPVRRTRACASAAWPARRRAHRRRILPNVASTTTARTTAAAATRVSTRVSRAQSSSIRGAIDTYAHNADEINHFVIDRVGACLYAADDNCEGDGGGRREERATQDAALRRPRELRVLRGAARAQASRGGERRPGRACVSGIETKPPAVRRWSVNELACAADAAGGERPSFRRLKTARKEGRTTRRRETTNPSRMMNPPFVHCVAT